MFLIHPTMDLHSLSPISLLTLIIFTFIVTKIALKISKTKKSNYKLPPGPWKLPLIGNMHQLFGSLPHHSLRNLAQKYGPLIHLKLGQVSHIVVSSPDIAKEVMRTHDTIFANRPFLLAANILSYDATSITFSPYGEYWRQLRRICVMELLSAKRVQSFRFIREEELSNFVETIRSSEGTTVNLSRKIMSVVYSITARAVAFGKKSEDQEAFVSIVKELSKLASGFSLSDLYPSVKALAIISGMRPKLEKLHWEIDKILEKIISDHKARKSTIYGERDVDDDDDQEDLVDVLLKLQKNGDLDPPLSDNNIRAVLLDMFSAGSETSATIIEWAVSEMLRSPKVMEKAQIEVRQVFHGSKKVLDETKLHELKFLRSIIKETLRLHPPAPLLLPRESSERCVINGYEIPTKTKVIVNAWAIGRDPTCWVDAERFFPERFLSDSSVDYKGTNFEYIPFGAGRRICPGITFGMTVVELALANLLYHFNWKSPNDIAKLEYLDMTEAFGLTVRRKTDMCLVPISYHT